MKIVPSGTERLEGATAPSADSHIALLVRDMTASLHLPSPPSSLWLVVPVRPGSEPTATFANLANHRANLASGGGWLVDEPAERARNPLAAGHIVTSCTVEG
ncbi:unnamed protein product [Gadus morhua 'NCC']